MENNLENAKKFFEDNNMEFFTNQEMNVIGKTMVQYSRVVNPLELSGVTKRELLKICEDFTSSSESGEALYLLIKQAIVKQE